MTTLVGVVGAVLLLLFFILEQFGKIKNDNIWYDGGNFIGAFLLAWYAYQINSIPFLVVELIWALVALRDIVKVLKK